MVFPYPKTLFLLSSHLWPCLAHGFQLFKMISFLIIICNIIRALLFSIRGRFMYEYLVACKEILGRTLDMKSICVKSLESVQTDDGFGERLLLYSFGFLAEEIDVPN